MRSVEELTEEAQEELNKEEEHNVKCRIKDILYYIADTQRRISAEQEKIAGYQKKLAEFKI